jgi:hypothetical protein
MWSQEKSQKIDDQDVNSCCAILSQVIGNIIFRCVKQNTRSSSLISKINSLLHYSEWYKVNYILKPFVVLSGKIAERSWREQAFVTRSEWQQCSWENKSFSRITRLHWNIFQQIHSPTTIIKWYNALVSFKQLLVSAGKIAKITRAGLKNPGGHRNYKIRGVHHSIILHIKRFKTLFPRKKRLNIINF